MPTRPLATVIAAIVEELTYSPPTPLDKLALLERVNAKLETQVNVKEVNKALYYMKDEGIVKNGAEMHGAMPTWLIVSAADRSAVVMPPAATPASAAGSGVPAVAAIAAVAMPPKRGRAAADEMAQEFRRHKSATEEAFAELVCPITFSLPIDPVTAEDGKVYERSAIEEWLKQQHKSPVTNLAMGTKAAAGAAGQEHDPHDGHLGRSHGRQGGRVEAEAGGGGGGGGDAAEGRGWRWRGDAPTGSLVRVW